MLLSTNTKITIDNFPDLAIVEDSDTSQESVTVGEEQTTLAEKIFIVNRRQVEASGSVPYIHYYSKQDNDSAQSECYLYLLYGQCHA